MQKLVPFGRRIILSKAFVQKSSSITKTFGRTFFQTCSRNDSGSKPQDPWDQPWQNKQKQAPDFNNPFESIGSSWSTGITKEEFEEEEAVGLPVENIDEGSTSTAATEESDKTNGGEEGFFDDSEEWARVEAQYRENKKFVDSIEGRFEEMEVLMAQVKEPGLRGTYLKDSEKQEMYRLHKENPEVYTVERLAKDFRVMRQRVLAILWLKEDQEEMEKKMGPLDDSVEQLLDAIAYPEYVNFGDREFHVAKLPNNPDFRVMPEDWDGTAKDPDEMLWEISQKEDEILYQEFVQRMNYNKAKIAGQIKCHRYSRRRPSEGWKFTVEELGGKGKRGRGGGRKFVSLPDGSKRPLNELEKMFLKRETNRTRRKIT